MTEARHRFWDTVIKAFGFAAIVVGGAVGVYQFLDLRQRELERFADTKEREFYAEFWNERLKLYIKTLDAAARISAANSTKGAEDAISEFWTLFDGPMAVVQDSRVDSAMHAFSDQVRQVESGKMSRKNLGIHSYNLGRICFESLKNSWNRPFSTLGSR